MLSVYGLTLNKVHLRIRLVLQPLLWCLLTCGAAPAALAQAPVQAHASAPVVPGATGKAHASAASTNMPWTALTASQREALGPLAESWNAFSETRKRKWIAIANTLPSLSESERVKLHERMEDWAKLSREDRELARLHFAQSKTLGKSDRAANWEAYQALSPEERQRLAAQAPSKPSGAALAVKPVASERLVPIPITRHTPESARSALTVQMQLDPHTLLPRKVPANGATSAPVKP